MFYVVVHGVMVYQKLFKDMVMYENLLILFILFYIRPYVKAKIKKVQYFFFENKHKLLCYDSNDVLKNFFN